MALATLKTWVKNQPRLQPFLPAMRFVCRALEIVAVRGWRAARSLFIDCVHLLLLPYRLTWFFLSYRWLKKTGWKQIGTGTANGQPRRIVMLVISDLRMDPRVQREAKALAGHGYEVTVLCPRWSPNDSDCQLSWGPDISFRLLPQPAARFVVYFPYLLGRQMLQAALAEDAWAYHAHDLDTSMIALLAAAKKRALCVCDFHEWYAQNVSYNRWTKRYRPHPFYKRWIYQAMERLVIDAATEVITVCESIGQSLATVYQAAKPIHIIRNIPSLQSEVGGSSADLRTDLDIPQDWKIVLYQGGIGPSRNLEPVIRAMAQVRDAVLVIRGPGCQSYAKQYRQLASRLKIPDRVFCLPPVPSNRVVAEGCAADMGLWTLLANVGLNFKYSLPNKVFEYLAAGLPILAADLPEVRKIVRGYQVGVCFEPDDPKSIAAAINHLVDNPDFLNACRNNIPGALDDLCADKEWHKLVQLYGSLERAA